MDRRLYRQLHEIERTHWWFAGRRMLLSSALSWLDVPARSILDVGCGVGTNLDLLLDHYPEAWLLGVDLERDPLILGRADRAVSVCQGDICTLPFRTGTFDLITALDTVEHVPDDGEALRELARVCRPGGMVLVTVPAFPLLWGNIDEAGLHYRRYQRRTLLDRMEAAGFSVRLERFFNYLLFPPIAVVRLLARILPRRRAEDATRVRTDFDLVKSGPLNSLLREIFSLEASIPAWSPPFGVSLLCAAVREPAGRSSPGPVSF